jgi:hypothetical protein
MYRAAARFIDGVGSVSLAEMDLNGARDLKDLKDQDLKDTGDNGAEWGSMRGHRWGAASVCWPA